VAAFLYWFERVIGKKLVTFKKEIKIMHSHTSKNGTIFHHNSDFSGHIIVVTPEPNRQEIEINGEDILEFIAYNYIMSKRISKIEDMHWRDLL